MVRALCAGSLGGSSWPAQDVGLEQGKLAKQASHGPGDGRVHDRSGSWFQCCEPTVVGLVLILSFNLLLLALHLKRGISLV